MSDERESSASGLFGPEGPLAALSSLGAAVESSSSVREAALGNLKRMSPDAILYRLPRTWLAS